jgi:hypothetical protein
MLVSALKIQEIDPASAFKRHIHKGCEDTGSTAPHNSNLLRQKV